MFAKLKSQDSINLELISMVRSVRRVLFLHFVDVFICLVVVMFIVMISLLVLLKVALMNLVVLGQMYLL